MTANKVITSIKLSSMKGEARVDSRVIAERLDIQHESFIKMLSKYENELKELGLLRFQIGAVRIEGQRGTKLFRLFCDTRKTRQNLSQTIK